MHQFGFWAARIAGAGLATSMVFVACGGGTREYGSDGTVANAGEAGLPGDGGSGGRRDEGGSPQAGTAAGEGGTALGPQQAGGSGGDVTTDYATGGDGGNAGAAGSSARDDCGNGRLDPGEECDLGAANSERAYGPTACTDHCSHAPYCGDGKKNGSEACDSGSGNTDLGSCNPECSGFYEKKYLRTTNTSYVAGSIGGIAGADAKCAAEFGNGWKALIVGTGRRATVTPLVGDGAKDWVIHKYTHYYSYYADALLWRTDALPLLGVRNGKRENVYVDAFAPGATECRDEQRILARTADDAARELRYRQSSLSLDSVPHLAGYAAVARKPASSS